MERKVIVLACPVAKMDQEVLKIEGSKKIKRVKNNAFFYIDNGKSAKENVDLVKKKVKSSPMGAALMFKVYPIYKGKIDMDADRPDSYKDTMDYYNKAAKDITESEIAAAIS